MEIAPGMEYLASKSVVHRRLATRNVLINSMHEVKITGFGPLTMNNEKNEDDFVKWVAPECMIYSRDATEKSDIWSYGVTLWEIFSLVQTPFAKIPSSELPARIRKGLRLEMPDICDDSGMTSWRDAGRTKLSDARDLRKSA
ncbi:hypothetical protein DPMN_048464 [Dreissena polymorpha]|uniref:Protein kinase domain-containing protein n=1 Tax=Dreissena polymorpha TaxID=45954 RepID=A0A9D4DBN2_DREPO|nr:hypothetical protein DPMN_048464 [Dreissena polymorpha]